MASCVVVGAQWGDEGKGKVVDIFTEEADLVVRFQGGNNAGHTLVVDAGQGPVKTVLHLVPSGILHERARCLIASGVVIDLEVLLRELDGLAKAGIEVKPPRLRVSADAHIIMPYHRELDLAREQRLANRRIGTTGRGIGPAYEDRTGRRGLRVRDILDPERLRDLLEVVLPERNAVLGWYGARTWEVDELIAHYAPLAERIAPFVTNCRDVIDASMKAGERVLFEGAQGALLDISHGTYPFVTSSHTTTGGVCVGAGVPPSAVRTVLGIAKAYVTRVGSGPFPTELDDAVGQRMRDQGHEYGSTTGRPRRCGWYDAVAMRTAHRACGFTQLAITKLDVLTGLDEVKICVAYDLDGERVETADMDAVTLERARPVYETLPGWTETIDEVRSLDELPANARRLLDRIAAVTDVPIGLVSIGPRRDQTILTMTPFAE